jgi:diacylglycerol kinase family enzyme
MKIGAVINNASGTLNDEENETRLDKLRHNLENRVAPGCMSIVSGNEIRTEIKRIKDKGIDVLIISGGDGTVSAAAEQLAGTGIYLLVLPAGTRNHFARDLGLPADPFDSIGLLDSMNVIRVDIGEVNGHKFINNATLGIYPKLVKERTEKTRKHGWRKWWAHIMAAITVLLRLPRMWMTVESGTFRISLFTPLVFVGNNKYNDILDLDSRRQTLNDGRLWLCIAHATGIWSLLQTAWQLVIKGIQGARNLDTRLLSEVSVKPLKKKVMVAIDGENHKLSTPLRFRILKKSLLVIVP